MLFDDVLGKPFFNFSMAGDRNHFVVSDIDVMVASVSLKFESGFFQQSYQIFGFHQRLFATIIIHKKCVFSTEMCKNYTNSLTFLLLWLYALNVLSNCRASCLDQQIPTLLILFLFAKLLQFLTFLFTFFGESKRKPHNHAVIRFLFKRRNRDLNPGTLLQVYKLSKPASSTT